MRGLALAALYLAGVAAAGCSNLPDYTANTCGNRVIDRGEDCDSGLNCDDQCRLRCPGGYDKECTDIAGTAYKCGADFFCHAPSGVFRAAFTTRFAFSVQQGRAGDIDGDKIGDIIGFSDVSVDVRFGDPAAAMSSRATAIVPFANSAIALRTITGDPGDPVTMRPQTPDREDILLPTADGIAGVTARNKALVAYPFSNGAGARGLCATVDNTAEPRESFSIDKHHLAFVSRYKATLGDNMTPNPKEGKLVLAVMDPDNTTICKHVDLCSVVAPQEPSDTLINFDHYEVPNTQADEKLSTMVAVASTLNPGDMSSTTQDACVVRFTDDSVQGFVFGPTQSFTVGRGAVTLARTSDVACPSLYTGHDPRITQSFGLDYYAATGGNPGTPCQVSSSVTASMLTPGLTPTGHIPLVPKPVGSTNFYEPDVLAVSIAGGLGGTSALYRLGQFPSGALGQPVFQSTRPLLQIRSGDIDGDSRVEAIASNTNKSGAAGAPDIDILYRTQLGVPDSVNFVVYRITTVTSPRYVELGDFDGNGITDIAYTERLPNQERLMIAYGTHDRPLDPVQIATFSNVAAVSRIDLRDSIEPTGNALDDLLIVDVVQVDPNDPAKKLFLVAILHGNPQRSMLAYYDPRLAKDPSTDYPTIRDYRTSQFVATVAGNFVNQDGRPDLFTIESVNGVNATSNGSTYIWTSGGAAVGNGFAEDPPVMADASSIAVGQCPTNAELCLTEGELVPWKLADGRDVVIAADSPGFVSRNPMHPRRLVTIDPLNKTDPVQPSQSVMLPAMPPVVSMWAGDLEDTGERKLIVSMPALPFVKQFDDTVTSSVLVCTVAGGQVTSCSSLPDVVPALAGYECGVAETGRISAAGRDIGGAFGPAGLLALCKSGTEQAIFHVFPENGVLVSKKVIPNVPTYSIMSLGDLNGDFTTDVVGISFDQTLEPIISIHLQCEAHDTKCIDDNTDVLLQGPSP
ncbi:MAG TPA: hypothetical protein VL326_03345 [Kofleriaceae bacterium]|jgi:hypothetical protein|nr:hypothetical protein [Kofleriaceae bacterium]